MTVDRGDPDEPWRVSATQIKAFLGCPRKWALSYLSGVPRQETAALKFGTDLHASIASYLRDRVSWTLEPESHLGQLTQDMARLVQPPKDALVEPEDLHFSLPAEVGAPIGSTAYFRPDVFWIVDGDHGDLIDWKSTSANSATSPWVLSSRKMWAECREVPIGNHLLWNDVQYRLYVLGAVALFDVQTCTGRWIYGSKQQRGVGHSKTWAVIETATRADALAWAEQQFWPVMRVMAALRRAWRRNEIDSPLLIPHLGGSCEWIGKFCDGLAWCQFQTSPISIDALHLPVQQ